MNRRILEEYLIHYQPELMEELLQSGTLKAYLDEQVKAMNDAKQTILVRMAGERPPELSLQQRKIEADQMIREMFMPVS